MGCLAFFLLSFSCSSPQPATVWKKKGDVHRDSAHPHSHDVLLLHLSVLPLDGSLDLQFLHRVPDHFNSPPSFYGELFTYTESGI